MGHYNLTADVTPKAFVFCKPNKHKNTAYCKPEIWFKW